MINPIRLNIINLQRSKQHLIVPLNKQAQLFSNSQDSVSFTGVSNKKLKFNTAHEAEIYAKNELGINAVFENNVKPANLIINALKTIKDAGYKLPNNIIFNYEKFKNFPKDEKDGKIFETIAAETHPDKQGGIIYFNSKFDWDNIEKRMQKNFNDNNLSSDNPEHLVFHEIGHFLQYMGNPDAFKKSNADSFSSEEKKIVSKEVGKYASTEPAEFIAEAFAAKFLGKKYSAKTEKLYEEWCGPTPGMKYKALNTGKFTIKITDG